MKSHAVLTLSFLGALATAGSAGESVAPPVAPTEAEWKTAAAFDLGRNVREECQALQLARPDGTWLRVTCSGRADWLYAEVVIAAGPSTDVDVDLSENWARVTFPVSRGDRRVMFVSSSRIGISAVWLGDEPAPRVVIE